MEKKFTEKDLTSIYCSAVSELGYKYTIDEDGGIDFRIPHTNMEFWINFDPEDPLLVRIVCVSFYKISSVDNLNDVYRACNAATRGAMVSKVYVLTSEKSVFAAWEGYVSEINTESVKYAILRAVPDNGAAMKIFINSLASLT
ncbi:YbjN domain-containing protein [Pseudomonas viridiflava]|uniref:YbjN domain-containing protein n=1 Tax=Pseudomonas viridiflava TaxID=33069 RepID=UPI0013CEAE06|nr:YbjN domain-containing protein [Pseudomonas viridiflava]